MAERTFEALYRRRKASSTSSMQLAASNSTTLLRHWPNGYATSFLPQSSSVAARTGEKPCANSPELVRTIEGEVIPRLMLALAAVQEHLPEVVPALAPTPAHIAEFVGLCLSDDEMAGQHYVRKMHARGMTLDAIYLQLIAPAARRLGEMWTEDQADFTEVTVALARIHVIVRAMGPMFRMNGTTRDRSVTAQSDRRVVLLSPGAGEQHTLGCVMIEDFFIRDGWHVVGWPLTADNDLVEIVRSDYIDVVGLSVSCENRLAPLALQIASIRRASRSKAVIIMVGGQVFTEDPQKARLVGADLTAATGHEAIAAANAAVNRRIAKS
jgi:methanogenic corrinoid protein MtbC1